MEREKTLIGIALLLVLSAFVFRGQLLEEGALFLQRDAKSELERFRSSLFSPLPHKERIQSFVQHIEAMEAIQERVSKSMVAKYFVDYRSDIVEAQEELAVKQSAAKNVWHLLWFMTPKLCFDVVAEPTFSQEQLLQFASLIDATFPEEEDGLVTVTSENNSVLVEVTPDGNFSSRDLQEFANQASKIAFEGRQVSLLLVTDRGQEVFESENVSYPSGAVF